MHKHVLTTNTQTYPAPAQGSTAGISSQDIPARAVYPAEFYQNIARILREMDEEDAGVLKPSRGDCLLASRTQA